MERLCRYLARPPIAQERLVELADGRLRYEMKKPWRDGTRFVVLTPEELIARLSAMVPPPWCHLVRMHGVFAPNARLRAKIIPRAPALATSAPSPSPSLSPASVEQLALFADVLALDDPRASRKPWAWLLRHVFAIDVTTCPECGGAMRWLAIAVTPERIAEGLAAQPPRARGPPRRADLGPPQLAFLFP